MNQSIFESSRPLCHPNQATFKRTLWQFYYLSLEVKLVFSISTTMSKISSIVQSCQPNLQPLQDLCKHFHRNPELSNQEKEISATVIDQLKAIPAFDIKSNIGGYGVAVICQLRLESSDHGDARPILLVLLSTTPSRCCVCL